jgi:hypothetical protein
MVSPLHLQSGWDMHAHGDELTKPEQRRLSDGTQVSAIVVCHHVFGLGVYIAEHDHYGHVNITSIASPGRLNGPEDFPPIGSTVECCVLGYSGREAQLRLRLIGSEAAVAHAVKP